MPTRDAVSRSLAEPGLLWVWVAPLSPFPPPMLFPNPCNAFISPTPVPPHMPPPCLTPLTGTTSCLGTSPWPSSKTHVLAGHRRRQSAGSAGPISFTRDTTEGLSVLSPSASFHILLQGFVSLRPSLPGEVTPGTQELLEGIKTPPMRLDLLRRAEGYVSPSGNCARVCRQAPLGALPAPAPSPPGSPCETKPWNNYYSIRLLLINTNSVEAYLNRGGSCDRGGMPRPHRPCWPWAGPPGKATGGKIRRSPPRG